MSPQFLSRLRARATAVQDRWRTLLHIEPVSGPLANPEALQFLIPQLWPQLLEEAAQSDRSISLSAARAELPDCLCGHNPYRAFFAAAEQAITEAAIEIQAEQSLTQRRPGDVAELVFIVRSAARSEIDAFCGACAHHGKAARCRFAAA